MTLHPLTKAWPIPELSAPPWMFVGCYCCHWVVNCHWVINCHCSILQHRASSSTLTPHRVSFVPHSSGLKVQRLQRAVELGNVCSSLPGDRGRKVPDPAQEQLWALAGFGARCCWQQLLSASLLDVEPQCPASCHLLTKQTAALSPAHRSSFPFCSPLKFVSMFDTMSDTISTMSKSERCFCLISSKQHTLITSCFLHTKTLLTLPEVTCGFISWQTGTVSPHPKTIRGYWRDQHRRKDNRSYTSCTESQEKLLTLKSVIILASVFKKINIFDFSNGNNCHRINH